MQAGTMVPGMTSPDPKALGYAEYAQAIETDMPAESPPLYGMHPNSEIAFLFQATETIFSTMRQLKAGSGGGGSGGNDAVNATIDKPPELPTTDVRATTTAAAATTTYSYS